MRMAQESEGVSAFDAGSAARIELIREG